MNEEDFAIVVGINAYPRLRLLRGALKDAIRFDEWLRRPPPEEGGVPDVNIKKIFGTELVPSDPRLATPIQDDVDDALTQLGVLRNERIGRRLYFYFAGHGVGPSFDDVGMLMAHAAMKLLGRNIGLRPYRSYFHDHALFDELVFIIDCCRDRSPGVETSEPKFTNIGNGPIGQVVDFAVMAAAYGEKAFEPTTESGDEPRGLLTAALLEGLADGAAADASGRVTSTSLGAYVKRRVPKMAGDAKLRQEPEVGPPQREIVFRTVPVDSMIVRIVAASGQTGDLVLLDQAMTEQERRGAADATRNRPWEVNVVRNRWYAVQRSVDPPGTPPDILEPSKLKGPRNVFKVKPSP